MTRSKYTDYWEAGHTPSEIIAQALEDDLSVEEYEEVLDSLSALEGIDSFDVCIPLTEPVGSC